MSRYLLLAVLLRTGLVAQTTQTFRADTSLVHVDVEVVEDGRILRTGERVCVMVYNSRRREIVDFTEDLGAVRKTSACR